MPGSPGWLACPAWLGWLGWIDWNDCLKSNTLDALEEVGGFCLSGAESCLQGKCCIKSHKYAPQSLQIVAGAPIKKNC